MSAEHKLKQKFGMTNNEFEAPIPPIPSVDGWKTLPIQPCDEPLVPLGPFSPHTRIFTDSIYFGEGKSSPYETQELNGSLLTQFVRKGVADRLAQASDLLPEGHALLVWDAYRPLPVQQALYDDYHGQLVNKKGMDAETASVEAQRFVSIPSTDQTRPPPHNTGGAVDLTIIKFQPDAWREMKKLEQDMHLADSRNDWEGVYRAEMRRLEILHEAGKPLDMGVAFDEVAPETMTRFYEEKLETSTLTPKEEEILNNRRLLVNTMKAVGLSNYGEEVWHFDHGNQFASRRTGEPAIYASAPLSEENAQWEEMRKGHYLGNLAWQQNLPVISHASKLGEDPVAQFARSIALTSKPLNQTTHDRAKRLEV